MDPMSLIGAGTSIVGGIMGAQAADRAQDQNWRINMDNFMLAEQERTDQIRAQYKAIEERRQEEMKQEMGSTDPQGNHTYFDPQRGWVTDLSYMGQHQQDEQNQLFDAQNAEKMNELTKDIPLQRAMMQRSYDQNADYADQADSFKRMLHTALTSGPDKYLAGAMANAQRGGINDAYDQQQHEISSDALRQGISPDNALAALARSRASDLGQASMASYLQGRSMSKADQQANISSLANLYNSFVQGSRSNLGAPGFNPVDASYMPTSVAQTAPQVSAAAQLQMNDGYQQLAQAFGKQGGRFDYVQPNYGEADAFASAGKAIGGLGKGMMGGIGGGSAASPLTQGQGGGNFNLMSAFMPNAGVF